MGENALLERIRKWSPEEREEFVKNVGQTAFEHEAKHGGCAQSTVAAFQQHLGIDDPILFRAVTGLAGGMGLTGESACGAVSGGVIAIGLVYGREDFETEQGFMQTLNLCGVLSDRFVEQYGSFKCHDVQKIVLGRAYDMRDPEDLVKVNAIPNIHDYCGKVCQNTAEIAAKLILEAAESE
jgi:C_GCAxxG_C_C family probable redox protein